MAAEDREPAESSLAASASRRVQAILEAAEASAAEIRREALEEAEGITARAHAAAGRAAESQEALLRRLEELHGELGAVISSLREEFVSPVPAPPPAATAAAPAVGTAASPSSREATRVADAAPAAEEDPAGVRLIALNMALEGASREQTAQFLAENSALSDPEQLLDEIYANLGD